MTPEERRAAATLAINRLRWAYDIIENHQGPVVFKKQVRVGKDAPLLISFRLPGVLRVSDANTGEVLAESDPGEPLHLSEDFEPPSPRLTR